VPESYQEYVDRIVDTFPPLSNEQRDRIATLLRAAPDAQPHLEAAPARELARRHYPPTGDREPKRRRAGWPQ
jgi:hypothetical protein